MDHELLAACLAGECSKQEQQAVEAWRRESPEHEQEFLRYQLLWEASRARPENYEPDMQRAWQRIQPMPELVPEPVIQQSGLFTWLRRVAAVLLAGLLLGVGVYTYQRIQQPAVTWVAHTTPAGQQRRLLLADGTAVWLNANSKLQYPEHFTGRQREVYLEGEAFFEVARDAGKPFLIHSQQSIIRVLGTSFSVRGYTGEKAVAVTVVTGKVAFSDEQTRQAVTLTPGEQGILSKPAKRIQKAVNPDPNFLAWKTRILTFRNMPLRQVLPTLEQYFGVTITATNEQLLHCRFTGTFRQPGLEEILRVFTYGKNITYRQRGSAYLLSGTGCQ